MITLRVDKKLEETLKKTAKAKGLTKSEIVRQSLVEYLSSHSQNNPHKIGEGVFGKYGSGKGNLSTDSEKILRGKLCGKALPERKINAS
jgi:RHH-type rel operon transcriptional repressor/antitoxin RelB